MKPLKSAVFSSLLLSILSLQVVADISNRQLTTTPSTSLPTTTSETTTAPITSDTTVSDTSSSSTSSSPTTSASPETTSATTTAPDTTSTPPPNTSLTDAPSTTEPPKATTINGVETTVTVTGTTSSTTTSEQPSSTNTEEPDTGGGLGTGSIIGMSVAGGVAVIGIIAFFVWKFTRKRFADFDDNEAIKWPDLNTHGGSAVDSHPLPVKNTGRSGFDTGSEGSLSRVPSNNYSTPDFASGAAADPYAVPPLPHLNPNQPYRDDPGGVGGYYDPYRGPIPATMEHGGPEWSTEAIPMTQMSAGGRMSPGPNAAYGAEPVYDAGRQSPGPLAAYGGRTSPGPQAAYGGRMSPGPHAAYGGAMSPAPPAGYDAYGGR